MRDAPPETNVHSELMLRMNGMTPNYDRLPVQEGDRRIGRVTEVVLRTESRVQFLNQEIVRYQGTMDRETDPDRRIIIMAILDELEIELSHTLALYLLQLHKEPELQSWHGAPIFTLRVEEADDEKHVIAVIEAKNQKRHRARAAHPYRPIETMRFFRQIVLGSQT